MSRQKWVLHHIRMFLHDNSPYIFNHFRESLPSSYCYFSIKEKGKFIGFSRVISDEGLYAFIVDVMIHPDFQKKGIGIQPITYTVKELEKDNIRLIQLIFSPELEAFYQHCGFSILKAGSIKNQNKQ